jgi:hypothetical protein
VRYMSVCPLLGRYHRYAEMPIAFWSPSVLLSVCAEETSPLCWLDYEELFLKCLQTVVFCWMSLVKFHFHFILNRSNIDEIKHCVNWTVFQRNILEGKNLPHFSCPSNPVGFALVHHRVSRAYKCWRLSFVCFLTSVQSVSI